MKLENYDDEAWQWVLMEELHEGNKDDGWGWDGRDNGGIGALSASRNPFSPRAKSPESHWDRYGHRLDFLSAKFGFPRNWVKDLLAPHTDGCFARAAKMAAKTPCSCTHLGGGRKFARNVRENI